MRLGVRAETFLSLHALSLSNTFDAGIVFSFVRRRWSEFDLSSTFICSWTFLISVSICTSHDIRYYGRQAAAIAREHQTSAASKNLIKTRLNPALCEISEQNVMRCDSLNDLKMNGTIIYGIYRYVPKVTCVFTSSQASTILRPAKTDVSCERARIWNEYFRKFIGNMHQSVV